MNYIFKENYCLYKKRFFKNCIVFGCHFISSIPFGLISNLNMNSIGAKLLYTHLTLHFPC